MKALAVYPWIFIAVVFTACLAIFSMIPDHGLTGSALNTRPPLQLNENDANPSGEMGEGTDAGEYGGGAAGTGGMGSDACDCQGQYQDCIFHTTFGFVCATGCNHTRDQVCIFQCGSNPTPECLANCQNDWISCMLAPGPPPAPCGCVCQAHDNVPTCDTEYNECQRKCRDQRPYQDGPK